MSKLRILPCLDSGQMSASPTAGELNIPRDFAAALGRSAVEAARNGFYVTKAGQKVVWRDAVQAACAAKLSIDPGATLPSDNRLALTETRVQVANETTLGGAFACRLLLEYILFATASPGTFRDEFRHVILGDYSPSLPHTGAMSPRLSRLLHSF